MTEAGETSEPVPLVVADQNAKAGAANRLAFLFTFTSFGVIRILGAPGTRTIEVEVWRRATQLGDLGGAAVLALLQLALLAVVVVWTTIAQRRRTDQQPDLLGAAVMEHADDAMHGRTTNDRIVDQHDITIVEQPLIRIEFVAHAFVADCGGDIGCGLVFRHVARIEPRQAALELHLRVERLDKELFFCF